MKTHTGRIRPIALAASALAMGAVAVLGVGPAGASQSDTPGPGARINPQTNWLATSVLDKDLKVSLTAVRSTTDQYAASVELSTYTQSQGQWKLQDTERVGKKDSWFWFPLTGPQAVCEFSTASAKPQTTKVSLLITPSIGCSAVHTFHLRNSQIMAD
ncbi:hypothetical protein ACZ90_31490 [Streptomyces albus subsp. albus]|nr:hypothetical protein ACZ90_31490 [Streptomyces albus subsp. albus]